MDQASIIKDGAPKTRSHSQDRTESKRKTKDFFVAVLAQLLS
jgi:hypothetical protein